MHFNHRNLGRKGQPVVLEDAAHGVVRVALGAADVCDAVEAAGGANADGDDIACALDAMVVDDVQIFRKIELLATHWETVQRQYDNLRELNKPPPTEGAYADVHNVDIEWLCPHERVVNEERVDALVDAILRWGCYRKPLLVDKASGSILDGHHRYFSAQRLGLKRVPAALVDYLQDESISVDVWPGDHGGHRRSDDPGHDQGQVRPGLWRCYCGLRRRAWQLNPAQ